MGLTLICQALWSQEKTIQIKVPEGYDEITYDASQVSRQDLDRWFTLSPVLSQNTNYLVPEDSLMCPVDDKAYVGCGREQVRLNHNNAERNQDKIRTRLQHLNTKELPPEFDPIIAYFRAVQSFALWRNQHEIDYAETRDVGTLERSYSPLALDPKLSCAGVLQQVRTSDDPLSAWHLVMYDWQNCMWRAASKSIGGYPQQAWSSALHNLGIREHLVVQEN
jgi:hypothetical protein